MARMRSYPLERATGLVPHCADCKLARHRCWALDQSLGTIFRDHLVRRSLYFGCGSIAPRAALRLDTRGQRFTSAHRLPLDVLVDHMRGSAPGPGLARAQPMTTIRRFVLRLLSCFRTGATEAELSREIHSHLQLLE